MKLTTRYTKALTIGLILTTMFLGILTPNTVANSAEHDPQVVSHLQIPFTHTASVAIGDTTEIVDFSGRIHVVVTVSYPTGPILPPNPVRVHTNMMDVTGVGQTSRTTYRLNGARNFDFPFSDTLSFATSYRLIPSPPPIREAPSPPPIREMSFFVGYLLSLNSDGQVTEGEAFPTTFESDLS